MVWSYINGIGLCVACFCWIMLGMLVSEGLKLLLDTTQTILKNNPILQVCNKKTFHELLLNSSFRTWLMGVGVMGCSCISKWRRISVILLPPWRFPSRSYPGVGLHPIGHGIPWINNWGQPHHYKIILWIWGGEIGIYAFYLRRKFFFNPWVSHPTNQWLLLCYNFFLIGCLGTGRDWPLLWKNIFTLNRNWYQG